MAGSGCLGPLIKAQAVDRHLEVEGHSLEQHRGARSEEALNAERAFPQVATRVKK